MPARKTTLSPWGKEVKIRMLALDLNSRDMVRELRTRGISIDVTMLSHVISGTQGQKSPRLIAAIETILEMPDGLAGRPV